METGTAWISLDNQTYSWTVSTIASEMSTSVQEPQTWDDATWLLTSAFIIFTMQSGFGLLESGCVSSKNEVNIMAKNVADVVFGGMSYWMLGYGLSYGDGAGTNGFCGVGKFFIDPGDASMGQEFSRFVFQSSFATTATTIVSGAIAERTRYLAYIIFSFFNTFVFCIVAHWVWSEHGWLNKMGVVDVAGDGPVHLVGGAVSLIGAIMIKPRAKRFTPEDDHEMGSPSGTLLGLFILWWGWLAFNCGSTYGISGGKWKLASRAAATTLMAGTAGGIIGILGSFIINKRKFLIPWIINGILGGLVSITGIWESLVIGAVSGLLVLLTAELLVKLRIDDPVSSIPVHFTGGIWGLLAAGIFVHKDTITYNFSDNPGLVQIGLTLSIRLATLCAIAQTCAMAQSVAKRMERGGSASLLGVQAIAVVAITAWSIGVGGLLLKVIDLTVGLRLSPENEEIGADMAEHEIRSFNSAHRIEHLSDLNTLLELVEHGVSLNKNARTSRLASFFDSADQPADTSANEEDTAGGLKRFRLDGRIWLRHHREDKYSLQPDKNHNGVPSLRASKRLRGKQKRQHDELKPEGTETVNGVSDTPKSVCVLSYISKPESEVCVARM